MCIRDRNWVEELGTAIANEEVLPDGTSERGGYPVVRKPMRQWMLKITAYAERLLADLDDLDWPESIKDMQRNWIGKSTGANVTFKVKGTDKEFTVFTTRPDTLFGATFTVLAPEHDLVDAITKMCIRDRSTIMAIPQPTTVVLRQRMCPCIKLWPTPTISQQFTSLIKSVFKKGSVTVKNSVSTLTMFQKNWEFHLVVV